MSDTKVSSFTSQTGAGTAANDLFPTIDVSASGAAMNKTLTRDEFIAMLASLNAWITNAMMANSSVTINGQSVSLGGSGTVTAAASTLTGSTLASGVTASSLTSVGTLGSLSVSGTSSFTGVRTNPASEVIVGTACGGSLPNPTIDVTKGVSEQSLTAAASFTFAGTPSTGQLFGAKIKNSGTSAATITVPSSVSVAKGSTITSFSLPASSRVFLTWYYDGTDYTILGDPTNLNYALTDQANSFSQAQSITNTTNANAGSFPTGALAVYGGIATNSGKHIVSGGQLQAAGNSYISFTGKTVLTASNTDGLLLITKSNLTTGALFDFTTADTAIIRNVANNAYGSLIAGNGTHNGTLTVTGASTLTGVATLGDNGTATASSGAATLNKQVGVVTTESLTTAGGSDYTLTLTNSAISATSRVFVTVANGTNSQGMPAVQTVTEGSGSAVIVIHNHSVAAALNGTLNIKFLVL